jgi:hypothetical protein
MAAYDVLLDQALQLSERSAASSLRACSKVLIPTTTSYRPSNRRE